MKLETSKPSKKPPIIVIGGVAGAGKSTLAAMFPAPVWIQAEEATGTFDTWPEQLQPDMLPLLPTADKGKAISTYKTIKAQIELIRTSEHAFETCVIDSASVLNKMLEEELCDKEDKDDIAACAGGFHRGFNVVARMHGEIIRQLKRLRSERGMAIVFTSHVTDRKIRNKPDAEEHTIWDLDMGAASAQMYLDLCDAVCFLRIEEFIRGRETNNKGQVTKLGKSVSTGKRVLVTTSEGNQGFAKAKNRFNFPPKIEIPTGANPLLELIPYYAG